MFKSFMTKISSMILAVAFIGAILSGCGTSKTVTQTDSTTTAQVTTQATAKEELKFVDLKWYLPPPIAVEKDYDAVMAEVNKMLQEKINAKLDFVFLDWANYLDKIKVMTAANEPFDLMFMHGGFNTPSENFRRGSIQAIDENLNKYGQDIQKLVKPEYFKGLTFDGKLYGIPNVGPYSQQKGISFKKDLVDKYKFDITTVKTAKDVEPFLETIKKNEPGVTPFLANYYPFLDVQPVEYFANKAIYFNIDDGKLYKAYEDTMNKEHYKLMSEWYKKGYIAKDAATKKDITVEEKSGKYAVLTADGGYDETNAKQTSTYGYPVVNIPWQNPPVINTFSLQTPSTGISITSANPDRAVMLLNTLFADKKLYNTVCYGLEGKNYTVVSGQGTDNPTIETSKDQTWAIWHNWIGDLNENQWPSNWNNQKALDEFKATNEKAKLSPILGFVFDESSVKNELAQIAAIQQEFELVAPFGVAPDFEKYWKDYSDKLDKANIAKVYDELTKQLEAWKTANIK